MERKTLKKKILGIFCTLCLCICMTNGTAVVYGAGVDSCVDRIVEEDMPILQPIVQG